MNKIKRNTGARAPGQAGEGISGDDLRFERYSILMSFDDDNDIPFNKLMDQWQATQQTVTSLIGGAKRMKADGDLADEFDRRGYPVDSHPMWFGTRRIPPDTSTIHPDDSGGKVGGVDEQVDETVFVSKTPVPIGQEKGGAGIAPYPGAPDSSTMHPDTSTMHPDSSGIISEHQQRLLADRGITYDAANLIWVKITPQGRGRYIEQVDPMAVLRQLDEKRTTDDLARNMAENALNSFNITTQAILKKVAMNPSVVQCFQYVSNMTDPETGALLFDGDIGDYISWSVLWATDKFYGVQPMYMTDRPSEYTRLKQIRAQQRNRGHPPQQTPFTPQFPPPGQNHYPGEFPEFPLHKIPRYKPQDPERE